MSLLILDDQLGASEVLVPIRRWSSVLRLRDVRPGQRILDDRVPEILLSLKAPTFVTIDQGFRDRRLSNPGYCIRYFAIRDDQQELLPRMLKDLLHRPEFQSRSKRMGIVARVGSRRVDYWRFHSPRLNHIP
jgi:hypothetical protein